MIQLSLFSADLIAPQLTDLGGLLAAHGQFAAGPRGLHMSIRVAELWRAEALQRECRVRDVLAELSTSEDGTTVLRSESTDEVALLASAWTAAAVKNVPADLTVTAGFLRCWTVAAGCRGDVGFLLGLDPAAPQTYEPLAAACAAAGLAGSLLGPRLGGPAVRIVGHRRCLRLVQMIGTPPPCAPAGAFPVLEH